MSPSGWQGVDHILAVLKSRNDISGSKLKISCRMTVDRHQYTLHSLPTLGKLHSIIEISGAQELSLRLKSHFLAFFLKFHGGVLSEGHQHAQVSQINASPCCCTVFALLRAECFECEVSLNQSLATSATKSCQIP